MNLALKKRVIRQWNVLEPRENKMCGCVLVFPYMKQPYNAVTCTEHGRRY